MTGETSAFLNFLSVGWDYRHSKTSCPDLYLATVMRSMEWYALVAVVAFAISQKISAEVSDFICVFGITCVD